MSDTKLIFAGSKIRVKANERWNEVTVEELPTKPVKKKLRLARFYDVSYHRDSVFLWQNVVRFAGLNEHLNFDQAVAKLQAYGKDVLKELEENPHKKPWSDGEKKRLMALPEISEVSWLLVEPVDYQPLSVEGKDFTVYSKWKEFAVRGKEEEKRSQEYSYGGDPHYSYDVSASPQGARKLFQLLKADTTVVTSKTHKEFNAWLQANKIPTKYKASSWN